MSGMRYRCWFSSPAHCAQANADWVKGIVAARRESFRLARPLFERAQATHLALQSQQFVRVPAEALAVVLECGQFVRGGVPLLSQWVDSLRQRLLLLLECPKLST